MFTFLFYTNYKKIWILPEFDILLITDLRKTPIRR